MLKFGKDWGFQAGILKKKESEGNFAKDRLKNAILKGGYASEEVLKTCSKQNALLKTLGSKMQFSQETGFWGV